MMPPCRPPTAEFAALLDIYRAVNGPHLTADDLTDSLSDGVEVLPCDAHQATPLDRLGILLDELALQGKHQRGGPVVMPPTPEPPSGPVRHWHPGDPKAEPGETVTLHCPGCSWQSLRSEVFDEPNGMWHALKRPVDEFDSHWRMSHKPHALIFVEEARRG